MEISVPTHGISVGAASALAKAAIDFAEANGWKINVAVVDRSGNLMAFLRMPESFIHSIHIAIDKAYTSASFGFPTSKWSSILEESESMKLGFPVRERLVVIGGGVPIPHGELWIGGIGVSGATEEQDEKCALAALEVLKKH